MPPHTQFNFLNQQLLAKLCTPHTWRLSSNLRSVLLPVRASPSAAANFTPMFPPACVSSSSVGPRVTVRSSTVRLDFNAPASNAQPSGVVFAVGAVDTSTVDTARLTCGREDGLDSQHGGRVPQRLEALVAAAKRLCPRERQHPLRHDDTRADQLGRRVGVVLLHSLTQHHAIDLLAQRVLHDLRSRARCRQTSGGGPRHHAVDVLVQRSVQSAWWRGWR
eukprot:350471-Chlamydomonas_euryale.AAC.2